MCKYCSSVLASDRQFLQLLSACLTALKSRSVKASKQPSPAHDCSASLFQLTREEQRSLSQSGTEQTGQQPQLYPPIQLRSQQSRGAVTNYEVKAISVM